MQEQNRNEQCTDSRQYEYTSGINSNTIANEIQVLCDRIKEKITPTINFNTDKIVDILEQCKIDVTTIIPPPPVCLEIIQVGEEPVTLGTLGNFSAVIGKAKSRKTFLITTALAAAVKNALVLDCVNSKLESGTTVLYFDTEQSKYHVQKVVKRVCELSGIQEPLNFHAYGLRPYRPAERLQLIEYAIYNTEGVGLVVIDGIRDLVTSINDEEQATNITSLLLKWTEQFNIHIIVVIHQNKGNTDARGHLGTEVINKAESVLSVTKDTTNPDISIVEAEYCRDKDFKPFAFGIDKTGLPYLVEDWQVSGPTNRKPGITPLDIPEETHHKVLKEIFAFNPFPQYGELQTQLTIYFLKYGVKCGQTKAKEFIQYYQNKKLVEKVKGNGFPKYQLLLKVG